MKTEKSKRQSKTNSFEAVSKKVKAIFDVFVKEGLTPVREMRNDLVSISNDIRAEVVCIFCAANDQDIPQLQKTIVVPCETRRSASKRYWNYGNLRVHLKRHVKQMTAAKELIDSMPVVIDLDGPERLHEKQTALLNSISAQNSNLIATTSEFNEQESVMAFFNDQLGVVKVVSISPDGNCLFAACVHQLYRVKLNSDDHKKIAAELRGRVCSHIKNNFNRFQRTIKLRVTEEIPNMSSENIEMRSKSFVDEFLSKFNFWGGSESLIAISEIFEANIIIFRENGSCYFANGHNSAYNRVLFLAYRRIGSAYNHYDSVSEIYQQELYPCVSYLCKRPDNNHTESIVLD